MGEFQSPAQQALYLGEDWKLEIEDFRFENGWLLGEDEFVQVTELAPLRHNEIPILIDGG